MDYLGNLRLIVTTLRACFSVDLMQTSKRERLAARYASFGKVRKVARKEMECNSKRSG